MKSRYLLFIIIAVISLISGLRIQPVFAQTNAEPTGFKTVTLWIYPEYDDPRLLVMLEGKIDGVQAPARVRFLVPLGAEMFSAGSKDAQGVYSGGPPDRKASSIPGWDEISYTATSETFRVEYYHDEIFGQPDKEISYDFRWLYPISDLKVVVQQPKTATNFAVTPAGTASNEDSFKVQTSNFNNLIPDPDKPLHFSIAYTKTDPAPSLGNSSTPTTSGSSSSAIWIPTVIIVAVLVIAVAFFVLRGAKKKNKYSLKSSVSREVTRAEKRRQVSRPRTIDESPPVAGTRPASGGSQPGKSKFCDQCGSPLQRSNKFCPDCGNKIG